MRSTITSGIPCHLVVRNRSPASLPNRNPTSHFCAVKVPPVDPDRYTPSDESSRQRNHPPDLASQESHGDSNCRPIDDPKPHNLNLHDNRVVLSGILLGTGFSKRTTSVRLRSIGEFTKSVVAVRKSSDWHNPSSDGRLNVVAGPHHKTSVSSVTHRGVKTALNSVPREGDVAL